MSDQLSLKEKLREVSEKLKFVVQEIMAEFNNLPKSKKFKFLILYHEMMISIKDDYNDESDDVYIGKMIKYGQSPDDEFDLNKFKPMSNGEIYLFMKDELKRLYNDEIGFIVVKNNDRKLLYKLLNDIKTF